MLESTKAIPWKIDWPTGTFAYSGPQIEELLGWAPESWHTVQDWASRSRVEIGAAQSGAALARAHRYRFFQAIQRHARPRPRRRMLEARRESARAKVSRPRDMLARFGGEEFALLLPETDAPGAQHIAKLCLEAISGEQIAHDRSDVAKVVTISVGVGTLVPSPDDDLTRFLDDVDRCLCRAKQSGRNRFISRK